MRQSLVTPVIVFGRAPDRSYAPAFPNAWQSATLRFSAAWRGRNQILVLLLVLDCPTSDYESENDDEDERLAPPATIWTDREIEYNSASCWEMPTGWTDPTPCRLQVGDTAD